MEKIIRKACPTNLGTPDRFVNTQLGTITEAATPGREVQLIMRVSF